MKFFIDNCIPPPIGEALRVLGAEVCILREEFRQGATDLEWMPDVAQKGWIAVTDDHRIRKNPAERLTVDELVALLG